MRILLINHYAGSPDHGMEFRPYHISKEWVKLGHEVTIVAADNSHLRKNNPTLASSAFCESIDGINYFWIKTPKYCGNGLSRVLNMLFFIFQLFRFSGVLIKKFNPNVIISSSTYPLDSFPAKLMAKKNGAKFVHEIHDLWPLSPMELGKFSKFHPFIFFMQIAENFAYSNCDALISILPNTKSHCLAHGLKSEGQFFHVPNGFSDSDSIAFQGLHKEFCEKINFERSSGKLLVGYAGGHATSNALEYLIQAAARQDPKHTHFFFVGDGNEKNALEFLAKSLDAPVTFWPTIPKSMVQSFLKEMDILYIGWHALPLYRFGVNPNKLADYLLAGRPIIHSTNSPNDVVCESNSGFSVPAENIDEISKAIEKCKSLPKSDRIEMGKRGQQFAENNLKYSILAKKFIDILEKL